MKVKVKGKYKKRNIKRNIYNKNSLIFLVNNNNNNSKRVLSPAYSVNKTQKMNWKQLKKKFPGLSPTADADFDGLVNSKDCRPFDPSKDSVFGRVLGIVTGGKKGQTKEEYKVERQVKSTKQFEKKMERDISREKSEAKIERLKEYRREQFREKLKRLKAITQPRAIERVVKRVETTIRRVTPTTRKELVAVRARRKRIIVKQVERFAGVRGDPIRKGKAAKGVKGAGAGRPKQSYKYRDPRTGQPISAVQYHKLRKKLKSQAKAVETQTEVKQRFALARRGLSPEEVATAQEEINIRMAQLRAIKEAKQQGVVVEATPTEATTVATLPEEQVVQREAEQIPIEVVQQAIPSRMPTPSGVPPGYRVRDDIMTGRKTLVPLPPQEAWTR